MLIDYSTLTLFFVSVKSCWIWQPKVAKFSNEWLNLTTLPNFEFPEPNYSLKNGEILILEDFVVLKKDVFAESSLQHAASWGPPFFFVFSAPSNRLRLVPRRQFSDPFDPGPHSIVQNVLDRS